MNPETERDERVITFKDWLNREDFGNVEQLERCWNRAATAMRAACVAKVKAALADARRSWPASRATTEYELGARAAFTSALSAIESLTLDQREQEKR